MAFGTDCDLDSGLRQNDGVGIEAKACNGIALESALKIATLR
jgi:hypothetical protein